jgi:hypothetical protein
MRSVFATLGCAAFVIGCGSSHGGDCPNADPERWNAPYCAFNEGLGRWTCEDSYCVG